jgi:hypothetical protein
MYRYCPEVSVARETGVVPVANGDPATGLRAPFELIAKIDTVFADELAT